MPPDPVRVADTLAWLDKAERDLGAGAADLAVNASLAGDAMFHAQQAVEKSLKGFLAWHDQPFRKTHDLNELGQACAAMASDLEPILRAAAPMTSFAWRFRYPGDADDPPTSEAREALDLARRVYDAVRSKLQL